MSDVLSFYEKEAKSAHSSLPELAKLQGRGLAKLLQIGFPTRKHEDWKYSSPDLFLQQRFKTTSFAFDLPKVEGVTILPFQEALEVMQDKLLPYLSRLFPLEHGFHALNAAMMTSAVVIYVPQGVKVDEPIKLSYEASEQDGAHYLRHWVIAEADAALTILEDYSGSGSYFTNSMTEVFLAERAEVSHVVVQRESQEAFHVSHVFAEQAKNSVFKSHVLNIGGKWVRSDKSIYLKGEGARCLMNGVYALTSRQHMDHHTAVFHEASGCVSEQDYKGILAGPSKAVFNGRVVVAQDAQKTKAEQTNKNLLLSKEAEVDTKPQLEIFANDVACSHGATVGQLNEDALFYFASRGLTREQAIAFLLDAFTASNLALIEDTAMRNAMAVLLKAHLELR